MTDKDKEKVLHGLNSCGFCDGIPNICEATECPYREHKAWCVHELAHDAGLLISELMKEQEPRVMIWEEAQANVNEGPFIIMEVRDSTGSELDFGVLVDDSYEMSEGSLLTVCDFGLLKDEYGKRFRCWTSRPTDEQREAAKWE